MAQRVQFLNSCIVLLLTCLLCSCQQKQPVMQKFNSAKLGKVEMRNGLLTQNDLPFTGIIYTLQPNQIDTSEIVGFNNGVEHGVWKKFYADGKLAEQRCFDNGKKVGEYDAWWPNGTAKLVYHFNNGEYEGTCREWTDQKVLIAEMNYKEGYEDGPQKQYYDNGKIKANYIITNGRRYGLLGTKNCVNVTDSIFKK